MDFPNPTEYQDREANEILRDQVQRLLREYGKEAEVQFTRGGKIAVTPEGDVPKELYKQLISRDFQDQDDGQFVRPKIETPFLSRSRLPLLLYLMTHILVGLSVSYFLYRATTNYWYFGRGE